MDNQNFDKIGHFLTLFRMEKLFLLLVGVFLFFLLTHFTRKFFEKIQNAFPDRRLLILQVATTLIFALYIFGFPALLYVTLRPPSELLLALGGSAAVAIGFALKDVVSSVIAGLILLFDRPFQVGDRVQFDKVYGEVVNIGLRTVRLKTLDDNLVTIPNSKFVTDYVASANSGALHMMVCVNIHTSLNVDISKVTDLLKEVVVTSRYAYLRAPVAIVVDEVEIGFKIALRFTVKAYVLDVKYEKSFYTDIVKRATQTLKDSEIERA